MNEIVINWSVVSVVSVVVAFVINQGAAWAGLDLSSQVKKYIVFGVALALSAYFAVQSAALPAPGADPEAWSAFALQLFALAGAAFKVAQEIYDHIWAKLVSA